MQRRRIWAIAGAVMVLLAGAAMRGEREARPGAAWSVRLAIEPIAVEIQRAPSGAEAVVKLQGGL